MYSLYILVALFYTVNTLPQGSTTDSYAHDARIPCIFWPGRAS